MTQSTLTSARLGWMGAGRMGFAMARRLASAGADLTVYNRSVEKAAPLQLHGARVTGDITGLDRCDFVFTMLSNDDVVNEALLGSQGLLSIAKPPRLVIDCSSISVDVSSEIRVALEKAGIGFLAAPVSGNPHVVEAGQASFVVSGPHEAFERALPLLLAMGKGASYVGAGELARVAKICHNVWLGALTQSLAEVTVLAEKAGMTRKAFLDFINESALGSTYTRVKTPHWVALDFAATFTPPLMRKDMDLGLSLARELEAPMPLASMTREMIQSQINQGFVDVDFSTLLLLQARAAGLELKPESTS